MKTPYNHTPRKTWEIYRMKPGHWVVQLNCRVGNAPIEYGGSMHVKTGIEAQETLREWAEERA